MIIRAFEAEGGGDIYQGGIIYSRGGSYILGGDRIFQGGIRYFRGGSYILGGDRIFQGGIRYFRGESDIFGGFFFFGGHDIFQRGSDIAEGTLKSGGAINRNKEPPPPSDHRRQPVTRLAEQIGHPEQALRIQKGFERGQRWVYVMNRGVRSPRDCRNRLQVRWFGCVWGAFSLHKRINTHSDTHICKLSEQYNKATLFGFFLFGIVSRRQPGHT